MTPYGIVYKDNLFALEHSCSVWQKKFGVLKIGSTLKISAIFALIIFSVCGILSLINNDDIFIYLYTSILMTAIFAFLTYYTNKLVYIKEIAKSRVKNEQKQAVIYDDKIVFTSPYAKSEFYYDEILYFEEKDGILTLIFDAGMIPVSIYSYGVGKGDYNEFCRLLKERINEKQIRKEEN